MLEQEPKRASGELVSGSWTGRLVTRGWGRRHGPRAVAHLWEAVTAVVVACILVVATATTAAAQFKDTLSAGPQALQTATMSAPSGLTTNKKTYTCTNNNGLVDILLSWTGSTTLDADGNYLVGYYGVYYALNGSTTYTLADSTSGAPPATTYTLVGQCSGNPGSVTVSLKIRSAQTTAGGGFGSAYSAPLTVTVTITAAQDIGLGLQDQPGLMGAPGTAGIPLVAAAGASTTTTSTTTTSTTTTSTTTTSTTTTSTTTTSTTTTSTATTGSGASTTSQAGWLTGGARPTS